MTCQSYRNVPRLLRGEADGRPEGADPFGLGLLGAFVPLGSGFLQALGFYRLWGSTGSGFLQALGFCRLWVSASSVKGRGGWDEFALLDGNGDLNPRTSGLWVVLGDDFAGVGFDNLLYDGQPEAAAMAVVGATDRV
jgi:hypothetical protein